MSISDESLDSITSLSDSLSESSIDSTLSISSESTWTNMWTEHEELEEHETFDGAQVSVDSHLESADPARNPGTFTGGNPPQRVAPRGNANEQDSSSSASETFETSSNDSTEPPAKMRKLSTPTPADSANDGESCPICLDLWGNSGDHRLVALKCGHLFGYKCVERWLRGKNSNERCCPTCKAKATIKDVRHIYAKRLVAVDTTETTALQKQVELVQEEKNQIQLELHTIKSENRSLTYQLEALRKTLASDSCNKQASRLNWRFSLDKNLEVFRDGGCRVVAYNCRTYEFYVSQKSTNNLFPGYGVKPVSCVDYKLGPFIPLHPKAIRDVAYSQPTDLLMSVGLDGAVKIVERGIPTTTIQCGMPLWSCAWDYSRPNRFYVGSVGGLIMSYDARNTSEAMETLTTPGDMSPNVSLVSTEFGLLSCQLNSVWLWKNVTHGSMKRQSLPVRGPFVSMCYDQESKRVAISCRPCNSERSKVAVYKLNRSMTDEVDVDLVAGLYGSSRSSVMSRAAFVKCGNSNWVAAYSESESSLLLHALDGARTMTLPAAELVLDVCAGQVNGKTVLAALSNSRLRVYKSYSTTNSYPRLNV